MRILVLGGTQFVGRHIVECLLAGGHVVTVFNRGRTPDELSAGVERVRGDRDAGEAGLSALARRTWDACIDVCGYTPRQVRPSARLLARGVGRYVFVSAVSVYGDPPRGPVTEDYARLAPAGDDVTEIDAATYGPLKVACENIVNEVFAGRCTILRPQIVVGPHEPGSRFTYWVERATRGGPTLAPGDGTDHVQVIDARDLATFTRGAIERGIGGAFNLAGKRVTWRDFVAILGLRQVVWVSREIIQSAGLTEFELPLYRPDGGRRSSLMHVSNAAAMVAGLELTDLQATVDDVRAWLAGRAPEPPALPPEREAELNRIARPA